MKVTSVNRGYPLGTRIVITSIGHGYGVIGTIVEVGERGKYYGIQFDGDTRPITYCPSKFQAVDCKSTSATEALQSRGA